MQTVLLMHREQDGEPQEQDAGCNTALCHLSALSLGSSISRSDMEKGVAVICCSAAVDLSPVFGLGKKLLCDLPAERDQYYLLPKGSKGRVSNF